MSAKTAGQFPHPFNGVQLRAVGREEIKAQKLSMFPKPRLEGAGMVITRVVEDHQHFLSPPIMAQQLLKKSLEALGVELVFAADDQTTVGFAHRAEHRHAFASGGMKEDRVHNLRRHPHDAAGTMLLEMAFVLKPQLKVFASGETQEFFYIGVGRRRRHGP